jgi:hypothetical protein
MQESFGQALARYIRQRHLDEHDIARHLRKDRTTALRLIRALPEKSTSWPNALAILYGSRADKYIIQYMEDLYDAEMCATTEQMRALVPMTV